MTDAASQIAAMEESRFEENKRYNAERQILLALAPDKWEELKEAFRSACRKVNTHAHRFQFECEEPDNHSFHVNRMVGNSAVAGLAFTFDPVVPRILWEDHRNNLAKGSIGLLLSGSNVYFANGRSGVVLPEFVAQRMIQLTR